MKKMKRVSLTNARQVKMVSSSPKPAKKSKLGLKIRPHVISFVGDREITKLAGKYRGSFHPTDVLAFSYNDASMPDEVIISVDTAKRQARERGVPIENELTLLCLHGILHNMGYEDETLEEWKKMKKKEFELMMKII